MVKSNSGGAKEKQQNSGVHRLSEVEHRNNYHCISPFPLRTMYWMQWLATSVTTFSMGSMGNQIQMHPEHQEETTFVIEWGVFVAIVMMLGLKMSPATFQRSIEYILALMQVFLDDFTSHAKACARHPFFGVCLLTFFDGRPHSFLCGCLHFICD